MRGKQLSFGSRKLPAYEEKMHLMKNFWFDEILSSILNYTLSLSVELNGGLNASHRLGGVGPSPMFLDIYYPNVCSIMPWK